MKWGRGRGKESKEGGEGVGCSEGGVRKENKEGRLYIHSRPYHNIRSSKIIKQTWHLKHGTRTYTNVKHTTCFIERFLKSTVPNILTHRFNKNFHVKEDTVVYEPGELD